MVIVITTTTTITKHLIVVSTVAEEFLNVNNKNRRSNLNVHQVSEHTHKHNNICVSDVSAST